MNFISNIVRMKPPFICNLIPLKGIESFPLSQKRN